MTRQVRVGVCPDFREERWPSMDRVANELLQVLARDYRDTVDAVSLAPAFRHRAGRIWPGRRAANVDRGLNRLLTYPMHVGRVHAPFDAFHVVDHSYSQLVHRLPPDRTIVTCHDIDTFRSVLEPASEPRSALFKAMTRHVMNGLRRAAFVTCDTAAVRDQLLAAGLVTPDRTLVVPVGVSAAFTAAGSRAGDVSPLGDRSGFVDLLHVGSVIDRKRIDVLLRCFAGLRRQRPALRLIRVGGPMTLRQLQLARELAVTDAIVTVPAVDDRALAVLYRQAALVLLPSEREGFGLPVAEALACGTPVVASNLAVLREVGGRAAEYCPVGDVEAWTRTVDGLLEEREQRPERWAARCAQGQFWAGRYTWDRFVNTMVTLYLDVAGMTPAHARPAVPWPA